MNKAAYLKYGLGWGALAGAWGCYMALNAHLDPYQVAVRGLGAAAGGVLAGLLSAYLAARKARKAAP